MSHLFKLLCSCFFIFKVFTARDWVRKISGSRKRNDTLPRDAVSLRAEWAASFQIGQIEVAKNSRCSEETISALRSPPTVKFNASSVLVSFLKLSKIRCFESCSLARQSVMEYVSGNIRCMKQLVSIQSSSSLSMRTVKFHRSQCHFWHGYPFECFKLHSNSHAPTTRLSSAHLVHVWYECK